MPLDTETPSSVTAAAEPWPEIDRRLIDNTARAALPAFPLDVLPDKWRRWIEAKACAFTPVDYLAQGLLAAVSAVCGAGIVTRVSPNWSEPLVLWQALVGGPSTGKTPALSAARRLLDGLESDPDTPNEPKARWHDELGAWLDGARGRACRADWLAGWQAASADARPAGGWSVDVYGKAIVGALRPERLADGLADEEMAARFLYAWPDAAVCAPLGGAPADDEGVRGLLRKLSGLSASAEHPGTLFVSDAAVAALEHLLPALRAEMREADGVEAAWIGKGAGTIVRLAGMLSLMRWAAEGGEKLPDDVEVEAIADAHALWSGYFLPHARAVFGEAGATGEDRLARRATRWLGRCKLPRVSRQTIRAEALSRSVDARRADEVIERLEAGGVLRALEAERHGSRGPGRRRWEVNPALL